MQKTMETARLVLTVAIFVVLVTLSFRTNTTETALEGRRVLCTGIIANTANVARDDPSVINLCHEAGVDRNRYGPTVVP